MLNRLQIDTARDFGMAAVPATSHAPVRSRVVLLGGANPDACVALNTRRLLDAASACIDWILPGDTGAEALRAQPDGCDQPQLVLSAPASRRAPWQPSQIGLFATLNVTRVLPGLYGHRTAAGPDIAIIRHHDQPAATSGEGASIPALMRTINLAFQFARLNRRPGITGTCDTRQLGAPGNPFEVAFRQVSGAFAGIEAECWSVSRCSRKLVQGPHEPMTIVASGNTGDALANLAASTVVTPNLISQIHAGERAIVFTSRHAEAAGFADCGYANPTGCILSAVTLLDHLGNRAAAATILHALLATLEEGSELTPDIACRYPGVSTRQFTNAVIANLGNRSTAHSAAHWPYVQLPRTVPPALEHVVNQ